jgi:helicase, recD/traA family
LAKTTDTLLRELGKDVIIKSKVIEVKSCDNNYKILKIELTSEIKNAIKGIYEDALFYSFTKNGRVIEGIRTKDIQFKGRSVDDFTIGEKVSIYNVKFFKDDKGGWMEGYIVAESSEVEFDSVGSFCQYAGSTFTVPYFKEKTIQKFIEAYAKANKLESLPGLKNINHIVESRNEADFIKIVVDYALKRFSDPEIAKDIYKDWKSLLNNGTTKIISSLLKMELTISQANNTYSYFEKNFSSNSYAIDGDFIIKTIMENPYILTKVKGIGFKTADKIGLRNGIAPDDKNRLTNGIVAYFELESNKKGNILFDAKELTKEIAIALFLKEEEKEENKNKKEENEKNFLKIPSSMRSNFISIIDQMFKEKEEILLLYDKRDERNYAISKNDFEAELTIRKKVTALNNRSTINTSSHSATIEAILNAPQNGFNLDDSQKEAVLSILNHNISCLTGGAGYGKTTVLKKLIECLKAMDMSFILCAPTGKAAIRMQESTGEKCRTIHKALGINPNKPQGEEVISDWLIVDESSMIDLSIARRIFSNINSSCRVVLVGDPNQLPPVGRGSMFFDLINSGKVNVYRLKCLHRTGNDNDLNEISYAILHQKKVDFYGRNNLTFTSYDEKKDGSHNDVIFKDILDKYLALINDYDIKDVCILTPTRREDKARIEDKALGCVKFNKAIRERLKPDAESDYEVGDRIMGIKNNEWFVNGQVGTITKIGYYNSEVNTTGIDGVLRVERKNLLKIEVLFDGDDTPTDCSGMGMFEFKNMIDYAYSMTVHKAQGSEYRHVIIPISTCDYPALNKNWLYTAVTRSKQHVYLYGTNRGIFRCLNNMETSRNTSLQGLLNDEYTY